MVLWIALLALSLHNLVPVEVDVDNHLVREAFFLVKLSLDWIKLLFIIKNELCLRRIFCWYNIFELDSGDIEWLVVRAIEYVESHLNVLYIFGSRIVFQQITLVDVTYVDFSDPSEILSDIELVEN